MIFWICFHNLIQKKETTTNQITVRMRKSKVLWLIAFGIVVTNLIFTITPLGGENLQTIVCDLLPIICGILAILALLYAYKSFHEVDLTKTAWLFILIGMVLNTVAESTYAFLELGMNLNMDENYPSLADFFWCAAYIPLFAGLATMFIGYKNSGFPMGNPMMYVVIGTVFVVVTTGIIGFLLIPILNDLETELFVKVFYLFYPIADLLLLLPAVVLLYITNLFGKGIISKPLRYMTIGFALIAVADLLYSYIDWQGGYSGAGRIIDIAWNTGYLSLALSAAYQKELLESLK